MKSSPVIILGCARSGTTLLTRMMESLGVFMGSSFDFLANGEETREATFIANINSWMLEIAAGPAGVGELCSNPAKRKTMAEYLRLLFTSENVRDYLGDELYRKYKSPFNLDIPWGWKDPVTSYTLPIWLELFPGARVIHVIRNGVAVAHSIRKLHRASRGKFKTWIEEQAGVAGNGRIAFPPEKRLMVFMNLPDNAPVQSLLAFWESMTAEADRQISLLPLERKMSVRFEAILDDCLPILRDLSEFVGVKADPEKLKEIAAMVKPDRRDAFRSDPEFAKVIEWFKFSPQMVRYSYS